jgi:hypothetical protein
MSGIISGLEKFFTKDRIIIFVVFGILVVFLLWYSGDKTYFADNMDTQYSRASSTPNLGTPPTETMTLPTSSAIPPVTGNVAVQPVANGGYSGKNVTQPCDLLPGDPNCQWSSFNAVTANNGTAIPDLLQAGYHIGLDTIGQTMKNANLQLRSDPAIPKANVGPWNQSTIEPDIMRVPLEVGVGPQ